MACPSSPSKGTPRASETKSCRPSPRRFKIYFQDDELRARSEATARRLLKDAMDKSDTTTNTVFLAKKALKYRNVYDRMKDVDALSPEFNASKFLGVDWCKTSSLKEYCDHQTEQCRSSQ